MKNKKKYFGSVYRNVKVIKMNEPITRCNKQIEKNIKENRKVLQLSMQESYKDKIGD